MPRATDSSVSLVPPAPLVSGTYAHGFRLDLRHRLGLLTATAVKLRILSNRDPCYHLVAVSGPCCNPSPGAPTPGQSNNAAKAGEPNLSVKSPARRRAFGGRRSGGRTALAVRHSHCPEGS